MAASTRTASQRRGSGSRPMWPMRKLAGKSSCLLTSDVTALSPGTFKRLCPAPLDEGRLQLWLRTLTPEARRAFWAGVLVLDGRASLAEVTNNAVMIEGNRPPSLRKVEAAAQDVLPSEVCLQCGRALVELCGECGTERPWKPARQGGGPRRYCSVACRNAAAVDHKRHQRAARRVSA